MTALQDWLSFRPVEEGIKDMVFRPLRAVLSVVEDLEDVRNVQPGLPDNVVLMRPGQERC